MININVLRNFVRTDDECFFTVEGKLQSFENGYEGEGEDEVEVFFGFVDGTCYSIDPQLKALAETLLDKIVEVEVEMDRYNGMTIKKMKRLKKPKRINSDEWTIEIYREYLQLFGS
jgi:hypothetical protein